MSNPNSISRRGVLGSMAALAAAPALAGRPFSRPSLLQRVSQEPVPISAATPLPRFLHAAIGLADGRMVVTGGYRVSATSQSRPISVPTDSAQIYDPLTDTWTDLAPMQTGRARHAAVLLSDGRIAVLGGIFTVNLSSIEVYDPTTNQWSSGGTLPYPMVDLSATLTGSGILVSGGQNGTPAILVPIPTAPSGFRP